MKRSQQLGARRQAGFSMIKVMLIIAVVGFFGQIGIRSMPGWSQYSKLRVAVATLESSNETDVEEIRRKFDARAEIDNITVVTGKDLDISMSDGGPQIHYHFTTSVPLFGNAKIVYEFSN